MTRRIGAALALALLAGGIWLVSVTLVRIVDWIVGGTTLGWATLIGGVVLVFIIVVAADWSTDGKVSGE